MSDEDAFLAAIAAYPLDDTPRLVYADWLDDRGDPWAEYVRLEVERHRLKPRDKRRTQLTAQLDALRPNFDPHWLARIDRVGRVSVYLSWPSLMGLAGGRPLAEFDWSHSQARMDNPHFKPASPGDYTYAVAFRTGRLYFVGRMRVRRSVRLSDFWPPKGRVYGTEGTPVRFDREVPADSLARLGWYTDDGEERRPAPDATGRLRSQVPFQGVFRLTPSAAAEFDRLLREG